MIVRILVLRRRIVPRLLLLLPLEPHINRFPEHDTFLILINIPSNHHGTLLRLAFQLDIFLLLLVLLIEPKDLPTHLINRGSDGVVLRLEGLEHGVVFGVVTEHVVVQGVDGFHGVLE